MNEDRAIGTARNATGKIQEGLGSVWETRRRKLRASPIKSPVQPKISTVRRVTPRRVRRVLRAIPRPRLKKQ
jgi:hypothetical protein